MPDVNTNLLSMSILQNNPKYDDISDFQHRVAPYTIKNFTGYDFEILINDQNRTVVPSNCINLVKIDSNLDLLSAAPAYSVIKLFHNKSIISQISNFNIDSLKDERYDIKSSHNVDETNLLALNYFISSVKTIHHKKIITLLSPICLENDIGYQFEVKLNFIFFHNRSLGESYFKR